MGQLQSEEPEAYHYNIASILGLHGSEDLDCFEDHNDRPNTTQYTLTELAFRSLALFYAHCTAVVAS